MKLDRLSVTRAVRVMLTEDAKVPRALLAQRKQLTRAVRAVARAFRLGGRLFYVGAGTSGRLGILDASECPVTFRSSPEMVQGIIAGGQAALWSAVEGAEDNRSAGTQAIVQRRAGRRDVVLGIAASGTTPFVWGALAEARRRGATTGLLCFNPYLVIPKPLQPDIVIAANLGPEVLTGSTRLKAGTATKLVLNIITTLAMVRIGKVISNLMVDVVPGNLKLRDRAVRIVQVLTDASYAEAERALKKSGWVITKSCARLGRR
jgi:N-acetylmuramic acid 6-phosphate etherase